MKTRQLLVPLLFAAAIFSFPEISMAAPATIANGKKINLNYTMAVDGQIVEDTHGKEPFSFVYGERPILPGLQKGLAGMKKGEKKKLVLTPDQAFGAVNPKAVVEVEKSKLPAADIQVGMVFNTKNENGQPLQGIVKEVKEQTVTLDFNHPLAGKTLEFNLEVLDIA